MYLRLLLLCSILLVLGISCSSIIILAEQPSAPPHCKLAKGYTEQDAKWFVEAFDKFRSDVAKGVNGKAKVPNMKKIFWSCALQESAQKWAENGACNGGYSDTGGETLFSESQGSKSAVWPTYAADPRINGSKFEAFNSWSGGYLQKGSNNVMAWGPTEEIGCGVHACPNVSYKDGWYWHKLITLCQFRPNGDNVNSAGEACSKCDKAYQCQKTGSGLCYPNSGKAAPYVKPVPQVATCGLKKGYNQENAQLIVDAHNKFRSDVALGLFGGANGTILSPQGSNMKKINWNCSLQASAQWWAENGACTGEHSHTGGENMRFLSTGQKKNVAPYGDVDPRSDKSGVDATRAWVSEWVEKGYRDFVYTEGTGHATAAAWAETDQIGCGYYSCPNSTYEKNYYWFKHAVVCQYRPSGNVGTKKAYKFGKPCSACAKGYECEQNGSGLCVIKK